MLREPKRAGDSLPFAEPWHLLQTFFSKSSMPLSLSHALMMSLCRTLKFSYLTWCSHPSIICFLPSHLLFLPRAVSPVTLNYLQSPECHMLTQCTHYCLFPEHSFYNSGQWNRTYRPGEPCLWSQHLE